MPVPTSREAMEAARAILTGARAALAAALNDAAAREAAREVAQRTMKPEDAAAAVAAAEGAAANLRSAQTAERDARWALQRAIGDWLVVTRATAGATPVTPNEDLGRLDMWKPIVFFPVRIETRFDLNPAAPRLKVLIRPDDVFINLHEPALTQAEQKAGEDYYKALDSGGVYAGAETEQELWRGLVARFGAPRAAWIVRTLTPNRGAGFKDGAFMGAHVNTYDDPPVNPPLVLPVPASRPEEWTRPAEAVLPDRWVVMGFRGAKKVAEAVGSSIIEPIAVTMDPNTHVEDMIAVGELAIDPDSAWTVDYDRALAAGMAVNVGFTSVADARAGFDRLIVYGVKTSMDDVSTSLHLQDLFDAHHYTRGLAFVGHGVPTNNTSDRPSGYPPDDPNAETSFHTERATPPFRGDRLPDTATGAKDHFLNPDESDGGRFAQLMGLSSAAFFNVEGATGLEQVWRRAMNDALWPATLGYYLHQMMDPVFDDGQIEAARSYFKEYVSGCGPAPAFRIGETPYGLLPALSVAGWQGPGDAGGIEAKMISTLQTLRGVWKTAVDSGYKVPRVKPRSSDPDGDLLKVLGMNASACEVFLREALGQSTYRNLLRLSRVPWEPWKNAVSTIGSHALARIGHLDWTPRVIGMVFEARSERFGGPLVSTKPVSETDGLAPDYISAMAIMPILNSSGAQLRDPLPAGVPLLQLMLRHAILLEYQRIWWNVFAGDRNGRDPVPPEKEWWLLQGLDTAPAPATQWDFFSAQPGVELTELAHAYKENLTALSSIPGRIVPTAELQRLFTETMDITSHRLDAWLTALASRRLRERRSSPPGVRLPPGASGSYLGGYGWVENLRPASTGTAPPVRGGYIHAPSMAHASAAAVLRSGHLSRSGASAETCAVDLSSARVRAARRILAEVRQGQSLGALLGYTFERALHDLALDQYIDPFRNLYPPVADKRGEPSGEADKGTVAARNVVNGLDLLTAFKEGSVPAGTIKPADQQQVQRVIDSLKESVDGLADVLTAEGVFQMVRGNIAAASATLDTVAKGLARPPDPEIARPARGGTGVTHRVALVLPAESAPGAPDGWPTMDARGNAEPFLNHWAGTLLGRPDTVKCAVAGVAVSLSQLKMSPLAVVAFAKDMADSDQGTILDRRVLDAVQLTSGTINYKPAVTGSDRTFSALFEQARSIADVIGGARALAPSDFLMPMDGESGAFSSADVEDFRPRVEDGINELDGLRTGLGGTDAQILTAALKNASVFVVNNAFPPPGAETAVLMAIAKGVKEEVERRAAAARAALSAADAAAPDTARQMAELGSALKSVFGRDFVGVPRFRPPGPDELDRAIAYQPTLIGPELSEPRKFLQRAARTHAGLGRWRTLSIYADAMGVDPHRLDVIQLPHDPAANWAALPFGGDTGRSAPLPGRVSLVFLGTETPLPAATLKWTGLLLEAWTEVIPNIVEQTGVAFHHDSPGSEAPQAVLVAVASGATPGWSADDVTAILNETLDLAKIRAVDADLLGEIRQLIPTCLMAYNADEATMSTNFVDRRAAPPTIVIL